MGDKVERFRPGDRVACGNWFGGFAERMVAKASKSARLPDNVDFFVGSTVLHAYLTAWYALVDRARLAPGETVLITGAAGGVGLACVEVARLLGGRVIAAVGSAAKAQAARDGGAEHVIDYSCEDMRERVKALTKGEAIDVGVDNIGGALFLTLARLMRWNGRLIPMGFVGGEIPSLPMNLPLVEELLHCRRLLRRPGRTSFPMKPRGRRTKSWRWSGRALCGRASIACCRSSKRRRRCALSRSAVFRGASCCEVR